ncbi:hypothetical protein [Nostoc sp. CCY 9925]|uniref:hypothetical protein n=1 Tax=Nostoc sp. CCY 9925 TaxID=3103865 RepID=UPI0039C676B6
MYKGVDIEPSASKSASEVALLSNRLEGKLCQRIEINQFRFLLTTGVMDKIGKAAVLISSLLLFIAFRVGQVIKGIPHKLRDGHKNQQLFTSL